MILRRQVFIIYLLDVTAVTCVVYSVYKNEINLNHTFYSVHSLSP